MNFPNKSNKSQFQTVPKLKSDVFKDLIGNRAIFQLRSGQIIEGTLSELKQNFLKLEKVSVTGRVFRSAPQWLYLDKSTIAFFHQVTAPVRLD